LTCPPGKQKQIRKFPFNGCSGKKTLTGLLPITLKLKQEIKKNRVAPEDTYFLFSRDLFSFQKKVGITFQKQLKLFRKEIKKFLFFSI